MCYGPGFVTRWPTAKVVSWVALAVVLAGCSGTTEVPGTSPTVEGAPVREATVGKKMATTDGEEFTLAGSSAEQVAALKDGW